MSDSTPVIADLLLTANAAGQAAKANDLFNASSPVMLWALDPSTTSGLTLGLIGGRYKSVLVANQTKALTDDDDNYVVAAVSDGAVTVSTGTTNWDDEGNYIRLYKVIVASGAIDDYEDHRAAIFPQPVGAGPQIPQNSQSSAYTLVLTDAGKHILHPSADTTPRTFTIPANASVAFPIGTAVTFVNQDGAGDITIAITSDTMRLAGAGTTGSRTLTENGIATALKITGTEWIISGSGLT